MTTHVINTTLRVILFATSGGVMVISNTSCRAALSLAAIGLCFTAATATAQSIDSLSGQIDVSLQITPGCYITNGAGDTGNGAVGADGNLVFGSLDFGSAPPVWSQPLTAEVRADGGTGAIQILCSDNQGQFTVSIDGGLHDAGDTRYLTIDNNTDVSQRVAYSLYRGEDMTTPYGIGENVTVDLNETTNTATIPIFGRIEQNPTSPKDAGSYSDTLTMTLTF